MVQVKKSKIKNVVDNIIFVMSNSNKKVGEVVLEILNKNPCPQHHAHYSQYSAENQQILCKLCPSS